MKRVTLWWLGAFTLIGFGLMGLFVAVWLQDRGLTDFLRPGVEFARAKGWSLAEFSGKPIMRQLLDGMVYGVIASLNILWVLYNRYFDEPRDFFAQLIKRFDIRIPDIIFISLCAGIGEELLFRGGVQHWLGIWLTSLLFIALHGYLDPRDIRISIYGIIMVVIVAGFGYLYERSGLLAAATAHTIIDIAIFMGLRYFPDLRRADRQGKS